MNRGQATVLEDDVVRRSSNETGVLVLPADPELAGALTRELRSRGFDVRTFADAAGAVDALLGPDRPSPGRRLARFAGIELDRYERRVFAGDTEVAVTPVEFALLDRLVADADHLVSRAALIAAVWNGKEEPGSNVLDVHLGRLRRKLADTGITIRTVRGRGYILERRPPTGPPRAGPSTVD